MNKRKIISAVLSLLFFQAEYGSAALVRFDVTGQNGHPGTGGSSGSGDGSSGTSGTNGQAGSNILLDLSTRQTGFIQLTGTVGGSAINQSVQFGDNGYVELITDGGNGGNGGSGGDGGRGRDGANGRDASKYSSGDNGQNGENGGDGGDGGYGGNGADSGSITLRVREDQTQLLMLVKSSQVPGIAGYGGSGGSGGPGGSGGTGGSSYSWSEEYSCPTEDEPNKSCTKTESNSGGSNGASGSSGRSGSTGRDGSRGSTGGFAIQVQNADGSFATYNSRYDIQLLKFDVKTQIEDGIYEPGENFEISNIKVKNTGGMPTPRTAKVMVLAGSGDYVIAEPVELSIDKVLEPGEEYVIQQALPFKVKAYKVPNASEERVQLQDSFVPIARLTEVNRPFTFSGRKSVVVTFPIQIEPVQMIRALRPGEKTRAIFKITNISEKAFGSEAEIKREVSTFFHRTGGTIKDNQISFSNPKGEALNFNEGILSVIKELKPKESVFFETVIGLSSEASDMTDVKFNLGLNFETLGIGSQLIQDRGFEIRVAQVYRARKSSKFVLVTNPGINNELILAWKALFAKIKIDFDIWDIELESQLNLTKALSDGSKLSDSLKGKTLVVLTNDWGNQQNSTQFLNFRDLLTAFSTKSLNVLLIGPKSDLWSQILVPGPQSGHEFKSTSQFLSALSVQNSQALSTETYSEINAVGQTWFWKKPTQKTLENRAQQLQKNLEKRYPNQRFFVVTSYNPSKKGNYVLKHSWDLGTLFVIRSIDKDGPSGVSQTVSQQTLLDPQWVVSGGPILSLIASQNIHEKIDYLKIAQRITLPDLWMKTLENTLVYDLTLEHLLIAQRGSFSVFGGSKIRQQMIDMFALVRALFKKQKNQTPAFEDTLARILARVEFYTETMTTFLESIWPWSTDHALRNITRTNTNTILRNYGAEIPETEKKMRTQVNLMKNTLKSEISRQRQSQKENIARKMAIEPLSELYVGNATYWAGQDRILSIEAWEAIRARHKANENDVLKAEAAIKKERSDLLVP